MSAGAAALRLVEGSSMDKRRPLMRRSPDRAQLWQRLHHAAGNDKSMDIDVVSTGSLGLDIALGHRAAAWPRCRNPTAGSVGQDHAGAARSGRSAEKWRHWKLHPCRTCARSDLCAQARRPGRRPSDLAARRRRAGARNRRHFGALRGGLRAGDRFVAASVPRAELEGEMGDSQPGLQARLMSQALRKLTASSTAPIRGDLHQPDPREDRRHVRQAGNDHRRPALKFYSSFRLDVRRIGAIKDRDEVVGHRTRAKVVKTSWPRRFGRSSSTSCMARGSQERRIGRSASRPASWKNRLLASRNDSQRIGQGLEQPTVSHNAIPTSRQKSKWRSGRIPASSAGILAGEQGEATEDDDAAEA